MILDGEGRITAVETVRMGYNEEHNYVPQPDTAETLPCDLLIIAAGFTGCRPYVADMFGLELSPRHTLKTEAGHYAASVPGIFAAGDVRRGQSLVVWAIAEGRECAREVDTYLEGYSNM